MKTYLRSALLAALLLAASAAQASLDLAKKNGCMSCHAVDKKVLGPPFREVAKRYAGDKAAEGRLMDRVKKGTQATGGQKWGTIPMTPLPSIKEDENRAIIKWVLSGAK